MKWSQQGLILIFFILDPKKGTDSLVLVIVLSIKLGLIL